MALIKCVECKKQIASDAEKCPSCGTITSYGKSKKKKSEKIIYLEVF